MISNEELGKYLKKVRESLGYSTHDINKLCDISQSHISLLENGKRRASPIILKKLSSIYFLDCNDLYEKAGYYELIDQNKQSTGDKSKESAVVFVYGTIPARYSDGMYRRYYRYRRNSSRYAKRRKTILWFKG